MRRSAVALAALAFAGVACSESTVPAGPARNLTLMSGAGQRGQATDMLARAVTVRVVDDAGRPVIGANVAWSSPDPGGRFIPAAQRTDVEGFARTRWVLGVRSGPQSAVVTVEGWDDRLAIDAVALPGLKAVSLMDGDPYFHMCAIDAAGKSWCWEEVSDANLAVESPVGDIRFRTLAGGFTTSCGLTETDALWCWNVGQWPNGGVDTVAAYRVGAGMRFRSLDTEFPMTCAVTVDDDGYCWGRGVLGDGQPARGSSDPVLVVGGHAWREIAVSSVGACGTTIGGETLCWTDTLNALQSMGLRGPGPFLTPTLVPMIRNLTSLTGSDLEQCGLIDGGTSALCWGWPGYRAPGSSVPYAPAPNLAFHKISAAYRRSAGLDSRGTVWAWRKEFVSNHGLFDEPTPLSPEGVWRDVTATAGKIYAILAADSTVHVWSSAWDGSFSGPQFPSGASDWRYPCGIRVAPTSP